MLTVNSTKTTKGGERMTFENLDDQELALAADAANEVLHWQTILAKTGHGIVTEFLRGVDELQTDQLYPEDTVEDKETGCQYYFHAHSDRPQEYGHFHTYVMESGLPKAVRAQAPASMGEHNNKWRTHCHLVGISVASNGIPTELFTLNHWSSQEAKFALDDLPTILDRFDVTHAIPSYPVNRWITAVLKMYRPVILDLFEQRSAFLDQLEKDEPTVPAMDNDKYDVTSRIEIAIEADAIAIQKEVLARGL